MRKVVPVSKSPVTEASIPTDSVGTFSLEKYLSDLGSVEPSVSRPRLLDPEEFIPEEDPDEVPKTWASIRKSNPPSVFKEKTKKLYELFVKTENIMYLYKMLYKHFSGVINESLGWMPLTEPDRTAVPDRVNACMRRFNTEWRNLHFNPDESMFNVVREALTKLYLEDYDFKYIRVTLFSTEHFFYVIKACALKGIQIDEEIKDLTPQHIEDTILKGGCIDLIYFRTANSIILDNIFPEGAEMIRNAIKFKRYVDSIPDISKDTSKIEEETVKIDGIQYSKKAFEAITECSYDLFIQNLELEKILNSDKDTAEESVEDRFETV